MQDSQMVVELLLASIFFASSGASREMITKATTDNNVLLALALAGPDAGCVTLSVLEEFVM